MGMREDMLPGPSRMSVTSRIHRFIEVKLPPGSKEILIYFGSLVLENSSSQKMQSQKNCCVFNRKVQIASFLLQFSQNIARKIAEQMRSTGRIQFSESQRFWDTEFLASALSVLWSLL